MYAWDTQTFVRYRLDEAIRETGCRFRCIKIKIKTPAEKKNRLWRCEVVPNVVKWRVLLVTDIQKT